MENKLSKLDPVIIDGKVIGFQWEHIWFVDQDWVTGKVDLYRKTYVKAGGIDSFRDEKDRFCYKVSSPDDLVALFYYRIKDFVNS